MKLKFTALAATALCTTVALPAFAQEAQSNDGGIAEIVVTAQKRAENVQDVPIAISAFTAVLTMPVPRGLLNTSTSPGFK